MTAQLTTGRRDVDRAFRIALGDLHSNLRPYRGGALSRPGIALFAGMDYDGPWTRDISINAWNGASLFMPAAVANGLFSQIRKDDGRWTSTEGQPWDAAIWAQGAWSHWCMTGDRALLAVAAEAVPDLLAWFEAREFDAERGLFRGPAGFNDGISAYPDHWDAGGHSGIHHWVAAHPGERAPTGQGVPMWTLATNLVMWRAYRLAGDLARAAGGQPDPAWAARAERLLAAIDRAFWNEDKGLYGYLVDATARSDRQDAMAHAYAILWGACPAERAPRLIDAQRIEPAGVPCLWPPFKRYATCGAGAVPRHAGTIWPQVSALWGCAAAEHGRLDHLERELVELAGRAHRDGHFAEIYHPVSGERYGGVQEELVDPPQDWHGWSLRRRVGETATGRTCYEWSSAIRQSWAASGYLRLVLQGLCGMRFESDRLRFAPALPPGFDEVTVDRVPWRAARLKLRLRGAGTRIAACRIDGVEAPPELPGGSIGDHEVEITLGG